MNTQFTVTREVFYSYSHQDERLREALDKQLSSLKHQKVISDWSCRKIIAGTEWAKEVDKHLDSAHIILLLISPDYMASDYCTSIEMKRAMERHEIGEACVIPIILRPCDWKNSPFGKLEVLPFNGKPISRWTNRDEAYLNVANGIRTAVNSLSNYTRVITTDQKSQLPFSPFNSTKSFGTQKNTKGNILVVDDNIRMIEFLNDTLQIEGYNISSEMDSSKVLDHIKEQQPDLIILDLFMPFIDGLILLKSLRFENNNIPIIVLTGGGVSSRLIEEIFCLGADYLEKPSSRQQLLARIETHLQMSKQKKLVFV